MSTFVLLGWWRWWDEAGRAGRAGLGLLTALAATLVASVASTVVTLLGAVAVGGPVLTIDPGFAPGPSVSHWAACDVPITWSIGESDAPERRAEVEAALVVVSEHSGLSFTMAAAVSGRSITIDFVDEAHPELVERDALGVTRTRTNRSDEIISAEVVVGLDGDEGVELSPQTRLVLLHELIHAVGVGHVEEVDALMYPSINLATSGLTGADLIELEAAGRRSGCVTS